MRIVDIRERSVPVSRYLDPTQAPAALTTSLVAVVTDVIREGRAVVGYGFGSVGRFAQGGLIRERFAPRLLNAPNNAVADAEGGNIDPFRAWQVMMADEKPGGHGERCVAVGALDMAVWDAAAKISGEPLFAFLSRRVGRNAPVRPTVRCYAAGGYLYPQNDLECLRDEVRRFVDIGFTHAKIKIGSSSLAQDMRRIEAAAAQLPSGTGNLAVDAMNVFNDEQAFAAATEIAPLNLWWFEDVCDPLDFEIQARLVNSYDGAIAAGEALFSLAEARLLDRYGGLRRDQDILVFDPVHCYGLPGFLQILDHFVGRGWSPEAFWPHGGHLFCQHVVAALGLGGAEINPFSFQPLCGPANATVISEGKVALPDATGIGFEGYSNAFGVFRDLLVN